jgi:hypothetical protein
MSGYHLAQYNIARTRGPLDSPTMAGFMNLRAEINAAAERAPGFVWRLLDENGEDNSVQSDADETIIVNLTVWESVQSLRAYAYYSEHAEPYRRRSEWFEKMETPTFTMWWIPAERVPTVQEGSMRLAYLAEHGPTPYAYTFKTAFTVEDWLAYQAQHV